MKKVLFIIPLCALLFSACLLDNSEDQFVTEGKLQRQEVSSWQYGTHILSDDNGKLLYALRSSQTDLKLYENKYVRIHGEKVEGYPVDGGPEYIDVTKVDVIR